jgi:hypothetical protein
MTPFVVLLVLMGAVAMLKRLLEPEPVFDRIAFFNGLLGDPAPRLTRSLPAHPDKAAETFQRIGCVALTSAMATCDDVTRRHFYTDRDFGDENDARRSA